jgi:anti-sigma B factor antagonist
MEQLDAAHRRLTMDIAEEHVANITIVEVKGPINSNTAKKLEDKLSSLIEGGRTRLVIDLEHVSYISSAGFRVLMVADRLVEEANGKLALCKLSAETQTLIELAAITDLFEICPSREQGLIKLS